MKKKQNTGVLWYKFMKFTGFQIVMTLLLTGSVLAHSNAQDVLKRKISIVVQNVDVVTAIDVVGRQAETPISYNTKLIPVDRKVSIRIINGTVETVLDKLLSPLGISYVVVEGQIVLRELQKRLQLPSLGIMEVKFPSVDKRITGIVKDEKGDPLPGVSVVVKGTQTGTSANENGAFTLNTTDENVLLVFSYVGYITQEVVISSRTNIDVTLATDNRSLDELVVVGYGTVKKSDLTGSVSTISKKDFNQGAITSVDQLMAGKAAGVQVVQNSGEPGAGISVNIRGVGSISAGNSPLYVIDGLPIDNQAAVSASGTSFTGMPTPRNPLNSINPNDIASIEILKDASATAIYGSRGANGVVLITTKGGTSGKMTVNYNAYVGVQNVSNKIRMLNAGEYQGFINAIIDEGGGTESQRVQEIQNGGTDWLEEIYKPNALVQDHNLSFSGGNKETSYMTSFNYFNQDGTLINSNNSRYAARFNLEHKVQNKFKFGVNLSTNYSKDTYVPNGIGINEHAGIIYAAINYDPTLSLFDETGKYTLSKDMNIDNPLAIANGKTAVSNLYRILGTVYGEYTFFEGFSGKINLGGDVVNQRRDTYISRLTIDGNAAGGIASLHQGKRSNYLIEGTLNFNKSFRSSSLSILGGATAQKFINDSFSAESRKFPSDVIGIDNLNLGDPSTQRGFSDKNMNSLLSYLGRVNYVLHKRYLLTTSMRIDGSSRFGTNNKFGYFPSFAFGWKINEESFLKEAEILTTLKLRASWGRTGNQEIGSYESASTFGNGQRAVYNGVQVTSSAPTRLANPNLRWETSEQFNIGLDFGIFQNRISGTLDWYTKNTRDMLLNLPISRTTGFSFMRSNIGGLTNRGLEFMLSTINLNRGLRWDSNIIFNTLSNKVTNLGGIASIITGAAGSTTEVSIIKEGEPLNSFYGYEILAVWQQNDDFSSTKMTVKPGDMKYRDVNGDGFVNADDRVILGNSFPDFMWSLTNNFSYKNFGLSVFIDGVNGVKMLNNNMVETFFPTNLKRNRIAEPILNRWTPENPSNKYPSFVNPIGQGQKQVNSYTVEDASYVRLNTVRLSYNLPLQGVKTMRSLMLYVTGQNLMTLSKYSGYDPTLNPSGYTARIDYNPYPSARTFIAGVNLTF